MSVLGVAIMVAVLVPATTSNPTTEQQMVAGSDVIVRAVVRRQETVWSAGKKRILTHTDIEVVDALKGAQVGEVLRVYQVGGSLDGYTLRVPGAHRYRVGEEFLLFAKRFRDMVVSFGLGVGKYPVHSGAVLPGFPLQGTQPIPLDQVVPRLQGNVAGARP